MARSLKVRGSAAALVVGAITLGWCSVAAASPTSPAIPRTNGHSSSFAGYQVDLAATTVKATFKLPALTCTSSTYAGMVPNVGLTNFTSNDFSSAGVYVTCSNGSPSYASLAEINNRYSDLTQTLNAGDTIKLSLSASAKSTVVSIADLTNKSTVKSSVSGAGGGGTFTGASVGESTIGSPSVPIAQFSTLRFSAITVNGHTLAAGGTLFGSDLYNGTTLQISAGAVSKAGNSFLTKFVHT